jgi:alpha-beta hydrolase superfamily lysophospholipase
MSLDPFSFYSENESMMKRTEGYFKGFQDQELFYQAWLHPKPVGTLVVTHGMGEHSECYSRLAEGVSAAKWDVYAWDLRGHGRSDGQRGVIGDFKEFTEDLVNFLKVLKSTPHPKVLLGHSMGGLINLRMLLDHPEVDIDLVTLSSPLLGIAVKVPEIKKRAANLLAKYLPSFTLHNEIKYTDLTRDKKVVEEYNRDQLRHDRTSANLYLQLISAMEYVLAHAKEIQKPILVQQAGDDRIVDRQASQLLYQSLGSEDKTWMVYEGFRHEIFNELDRDRVFSDLVNWLEIHKAGATHGLAGGSRDS